MGPRLGRPVQKTIELAAFAGLNTRQTRLLRRMPRFCREARASYACGLFEFTRR